MLRLSVLSLLISSITPIIPSKPTRPSVPPFCRDVFGTTKPYYNACTSQLDMSLQGHENSSLALPGLVLSSFWLFISFSNNWFRPFVFVSIMHRIIYSDFFFYCYRISGWWLSFHISCFMYTSSFWAAAPQGTTYGTTKWGDHVGRGMVLYSLSFLSRLYIVIDLCSFFLTAGLDESPLSKWRIKW